MDLAIVCVKQEKSLASCSVRLRALFPGLSRDVRRRLSAAAETANITVDYLCCAAALLDKRSVLAWQREKRAPIAAACEQFLLNTSVT
jgi:hypothetical protein